MTTPITKEQLRAYAEKKVNSLRFAIKQSAFTGITEGLEKELHLAEFALAAIGAEPVFFITVEGDDWIQAGRIPGSTFDFNNLPDGINKLYTAPQAPVVPYEMPVHTGPREFGRPQAYVDGWNACRAAMLQGAEHVTTACKLRDAMETIRNSGIEIDAEKIFAERDALNSQDCWCRTCRPVTISDMRFVVCPECGNKRCPHANDHRNACTESNEPGQEGSAYPAAPQQEVTLALAKGMQRYGTAMRELAKKEGK